VLNISSLINSHTFTFLRFVSSQVLSISTFKLTFNRNNADQRHQSGLKSGEVVDPDQKILIFYENLGKNFDFFRQHDKQKMDFSG